MGYDCHLGQMAQVITFLGLAEGLDLLVTDQRALGTWGSRADKFRHKEFNTCFVIFQSVYGKFGIRYSTSPPPITFHIGRSHPGIKCYWYTATWDCRLTERALRCMGSIIRTCCILNQNAASLATCICSLHIFPSRPCLNGCVFHSRTCYNHLSSI